MGVASLLAPEPVPYALFNHPRLASVDIDGAFRALAEVSLIAAGEDPDIAESRWTLARVLIAQGRTAEAEPLLRAAIAALEARVTPQHVWLKGARATLASLTGP
jgi:hypothetical protein